MTLLIERKAKQARALVEQQLVHPLLRWLLVKALWWPRGGSCKCLQSQWTQVLGFRMVLARLSLLDSVSVF